MTYTGDDPPFALDVPHTLGIADHEPADIQVSSHLDSPPSSPQGPDRATIYVPTDDTMVNLGQGIPGSLDTGITGRTAHHVHFHTMGATDVRDDGVRTLVRAGSPAADLVLGKGPTELALEAEIALVTTLGYVESPGIDPVRHLEILRARLDYERSVRSIGRSRIGSVFPPSHAEWPGYSMITRGGAVHESRLNQVIVSGEGDLRLAGKRSVSVGSSGDVLIAVHNGIDVGEFCKNTNEPQRDPGLPGPGKIHRDVVDSINAVNTVFSAACATFYRAMNLVQGYNKTPMFESDGGGVAGWQGIGVADCLFSGVVPRLLSTIAGPALLALSPMLDGAGGRLDLYSSSSVNITGQLTAKLSSSLYTGIASHGAVVINGGQALAMSGNALATLGAPIVSIGAVTKLSLESMVGPMTLRARSTMELSTQRNLVFGANEAIQVACMEGQLTLFGREGFFLAGGGGDREGPVSRYSEVNYRPQAGYGVKGTRDELYLGKLERANAGFDHPSWEQNRGMCMNNQGVSVRWGDDSILRLDNDGALVEGASININAKTGHLRVRAQGRVLLGD